MLMSYLLFVGSFLDLSYELVEFAFFQADAFGFEIVNDVFTEVLTLLGGKQKTQRCTYECAAYHCQYNV